MGHAELFTEIVRACAELPADVRSQADKARAVEETCFDESYIEFLETQIRLNPRGPEWTHILKRRRQGLRQFCGVTLLSGHVRVGRFDTWVKIDPRRKVVVFWEQLDYGVEAEQVRE